MPNLNDKTNVICGRNPLCKNIHPAFSRPEQTSAALWMTGNQVNAERSGEENYTGDISGECIQNFRLTSDQEQLNAVVFENTSAVMLNPEITLSGCGCSDFTCKGTAVLAEANSKVDIRGAEITTRGATRAATIATTGAVLKVFDSTLATYGGPLPEDYVPVIGPGMMEPPAPLGLAGNCRTHLSMDHSESYFYNCKVYGEAWAALSTDSSGGYVYMEANDCKVTMHGNGYCIYADNGCHVVLNRCQLSSGNVFGIQDGNSTVRMTDVSGDCEGYGFLIHGGMHDLEDIGTLRFRNCSLTSTGPMFRCKSTNVDIYVENSNLVSKEGKILESILTDDKFYYQTRSHAEDDYGIQFTFEGCELFGSMVCADPERQHKLNFSDTALTGQITGYPILRLCNESSFVATENSEITLADADVSGIDAAVGVAISAKGISGTSTLPSGGTLAGLD